MNQDDTVREDIGYRGPMENSGANVYKMTPKKEIYVPFIRVRYIRGMLKGEMRRLNAEIANDLIRRNYAINLDSQQGGSRSNRQAADDDVPF